MRSAKLRQKYEQARIIKNTQWYAGHLHRTPPYCTVHPHTALYTPVLHCTLSYCTVHVYHTPCCTEHVRCNMA